MTVRRNIYSREEEIDSIGTDGIGSIDANERGLTSVNINTVRTGSSIIGVEVISSNNINEGRVYSDSTPFLLC